MFKFIIKQISIALALSFRLMITFYQKCISVLFPASCRFYPTCSCYAKTVLKEQPLYKALPLIVWRLLRCQPLSKGGFDYPPKPSRKCKDLKNA